MKRRWVLLGTAVLLLSVASTVSAEDDVPSAPLNLEAEAGDGHVNLTWEHPIDVSPSNITSYWVYWYPYPVPFGGWIIFPPDTNTTNWIGKSIPGNSSAHTLTGLDNGILYYFHVRAHIGGVESDHSNLVSAKPARLPSEPRGLTAELRDGEVFLEWEPPEITGDWMISAYQVMRGPTPKHMEDIASLPSRFIDWGLWRTPPTNYTDDDLEGKEAWYYQVIAYNSAGAGPPSRIVFVGDRDLVPVAPSIPGNTKTWVQNGHINITWSPPGFDGGWNVFKYRIYRWTNTSDVKAIGDVPSNYLYHLDVYVTPGVEYHYAVAAWNAVGESPLGLDVTAMVPRATIEEPEQPIPDDPEGSEGSSLYIIPVLVGVILIPLAIWVLYPRIRRWRDRGLVD